LRSAREIATASLVTHQPAHRGLPQLLLLGLFAGYIQVSVPDQCRNALTVHWMLLRWFWHSLFPLLEKDELVLPYVICLLLFFGLAMRFVGMQQSHPLEALIPTSWLRVFLMVG
jgi:hypothetical protein